MTQERGSQKRARCRLAHQQTASLAVRAEDGGRAGHLDDGQLAALGICTRGKCTDAVKTPVFKAWRGGSPVSTVLHGTQPFLSPSGSFSLSVKGFHGAVTHPFKPSPVVLLRRS